MAGFLMSSFVALCLCAGLIGHAGASTFLRRSEVESAESAQAPLHLLEELEGALGQAHRQATERRISRLQDALRPTVAALPKDANGNLGRMAVRYVLHRIFVEKHAWYVQGLAPSGAWNESSPTAMFQGQVPGAIFESRMDNKTFGLHELAVLAATLENLVHEESVRRLQEAYEAQGLDVNSKGITEEQCEKIVLTYLVMYILRAKAPAAARGIAAPAQIRKAYPSWPDTVEFVREIRNEVFDRADANASSLTFSDTIKVVEEFSERYGRWQDRECRELKHNLVKMEIPGTGRVLLKDFYTSGQWQFAESASYLRQMGALDDSDAARLKVIIPNYVNAPTNCLASSSFYSVCCIDECEALVSHVERQIAAPEAAPERVAEVVSALPSATVEAPRELSAPLRARLDEIASHHGHGRVPLHSRLFAQFMHHAYPRECSFPHAGGTVRPLAAAEWEADDAGARATHEEVRQHIENTAAREDGADEELPWTVEEELFCAHPAQAPAAGQGILRTLSRVFMFAAMLLSISLMLLRKAALATSTVGMSPDKFYV